MSDLAEQNRTAWDARAKSYDKEEWAQKIATQLISEIRSRLDFIGAQWSSDSAQNTQQREVKLLDYACGTGMVTRALQDHVTTVRGIDISSGMVSIYNERMQAAGTAKASATVGNLLGSTPTPPITEAEYTDFDIAVVALGFHHFENPKLTLERLAERLKPGAGVLVILDWIPSDSDPKFEGEKGGHHHHHHHHHHHGAEVDKADKHEMSHTIGQDGFNAEMMKELYESAGLVDFGFETMEEPVTLVMGGKPVKRTPFLTRGRRS